MAFNHTLSGIMRGKWLIDKPWAMSQLPILLSMLNGNAVSFNYNQAEKKDGLQRPGYSQNEMPYCIDPKTMQQSNAYINTWERGWVPNPNIAEGSVAIVPISGPITKYNGECGEYGSIKRASWLHEFASRKNIGSIVQIIDTPGGEARAANGYVTAMKSTGKPVLSLVDGMCASLGVWYSSNSDEVYMSSEMDEIGSIGSYCSLLDFTGYLEKEGIKLIEVYAPQSTDKNKDYRDALAGDTAAIENDLKLHVDAFISSVKNGRGDKAAAREKEWSSGKMFYAKDAVKIGLADGIATFEHVVSKASWLSKRNK